MIHCNTKWRNTELQFQCVQGFGHSRGTFQHLRLLAFDPYDLALSKLERNIQRDRDDVLHLARTVPLELKVLKDRYQKELRWQLGNPERRPYSSTVD